MFFLTNTSRKWKMILTHTSCISFSFSMFTCFAFSEHNVGNKFFSKQIMISFILSHLFGKFLVESHRKHLHEWVVEIVADIIEIKSNKLHCKCFISATKKKQFSKRLITIMKADFWAHKSQNTHHKNTFVVITDFDHDHHTTWYKYNKKHESKIP